MQFHFKKWAYSTCLFKHIGLSQLSPYSHVQTQLQPLWALRLHAGPGIAANVTNAWRASTIIAFGSTPALDGGTIIVGCCSCCCCVAGALVESSLKNVVLWESQGVLIETCACFRIKYFGAHCRCFLKSTQGLLGKMFLRLFWGVVVSC